jgi:hypothetical protein
MDLLICRGMQRINDIPPGNTFSATRNGPIWQMVKFRKLENRSQQQRNVPKTLITLTDAMARPASSCSPNRYGDIVGRELARGGPK